jgi:hypothetical protein
MTGAQLVGVDVGNWCVLWILPQFLILIPDVEISEAVRAPAAVWHDGKDQMFPRPKISKHLV